MISFGYGKRIKQELCKFRPELLRSVWGQKREDAKGREVPFGGWFQERRKATKKAVPGDCFAFKNARQINQTYIALSASLQRGEF